MCGRYNLRATPQEIAEAFALFREPEIVPRFNIAPTQAVPIVRRTQSGERELSFVRWGLIPSWAKDPRIGSSLINARADGIETKPSFRSAFKRRRCLVPANGFYEWQAIPGKKVKQPFEIELKQRGPFAFAGLWETWKDPEGSPLETCTIITTEPNEMMSTIHTRMPVILHREDHARWLETAETDAQSLLPLLTAYPADEMQMHAVSTLVNNVKNESPECLKPAEQRSLF